VPEQAFQRAVEALSHKERTAAELGAWLAARGFATEKIEDAVARLIEAGLLDDGAFARRFAADKRELSGWGPSRIRAALADRGLDRELIEGAVGEDRPAQLARALELLERRGEPPVDEASRARAFGFLARRGYESELAYEAIRDFGRRAA
jgi:regulatory protein